MEMHEEQEQHGEHEGHDAQQHHHHHLEQHHYDDNDQHQQQQHDGDHHSILPDIDTNMIDPRVTESEQAVADAAGLPHLAETAAAAAIAASTSSNTAMPAPSKKRKVAQADHTEQVQPVSQQAIASTSSAIPTDYDLNGHQQPQQQQQPQQSQDLPTAAAGDGDTAATKQVKNSKRAAQNRAAQKAFRERKEQYVKQLELKASQMDAVLQREAAYQERIQALELDLQHQQRFSQEQETMLQDMRTKEASWTAERKKLLDDLASLRKKEEAARNELLASKSGE